ncbi:MAG: redox-sensing transcriptional repressor Rex [Candidatus Omnitrophica bacterium]|nr:redox-sensing transcriptional repressor Rex [Candidatus Omnitrophota bacterium]
MATKRIPETTVKRLFIYLREVTELSEFNIRTVSSSELGERTNLSDAQVRKDLGYFGQFGVSGSGYNVLELKKALERIVGKDKRWKVALVGVGHLGEALLSYSGFTEQGLDIVSAFDVSEDLVGASVKGVKVESFAKLREAVKENGIPMAIIAVPAGEAQKAADVLVDSGIKCILNFAPVNLDVPGKIKVNNVDLSRELEILAYFLASGNGGWR